MNGNGAVFSPAATPKSMHRRSPAEIVDTEWGDRGSSELLRHSHFAAIWARVKSLTERDSSSLIDTAFCVASFMPVPCVRQCHKPGLVLWTVGIEGDAGYIIGNIASIVTAYRTTSVCARQITIQDPICHAFQMAQSATVAPRSIYHMPEFNRSPEN